MNLGLETGVRGIFKCNVRTKFVKRKKELLKNRKASVSCILPVKEKILLVDGNKNIGGRSEISNREEK